MEVTSRRFRVSAAYRIGLVRSRPWSPPHYIEIFAQLQKPIKYGYPHQFGARVALQDDLNSIQRSSVTDKSDGLTRYRKFAMADNDPGMFCSIPFPRHLECGGDPNISQNLRVSSAAADTTVEPSGEVSMCNTLPSTRRKHR